MPFVHPQRTLRAVVETDSEEINHRKQLRALARVIRYPGIKARTESLSNRWFVKPNLTGVAQITEAADDLKIVMRQICQVVNNILQ